MYYPQNIEEICYDENHIKEVVKEIENNFQQFFNRFIETENGNKITEDLFENIGKQIQTSNIRISRKDTDIPKNFKRIVIESIKRFEKDRERYIELLDPESLEEHLDDPINFKNSTLKNECPIIRLTLNNTKAKELDKFRKDFKMSKPKDLLTVVTNLSNFAHEYYDNIYDENKYEKITTLEELDLGDLDGEDYTAYGVIGGGIKSQMLYKVYPSIFPNRSREAIWALWYLTKKKTFGCEQDSEFLMINTNETTTQQNFFYPYELFSFYAYTIYKLLNNEALKNKVYIDKEYRYIIVDEFLSYIANENKEEINFYRSQIKENGYAHNY